MRHLPGECVDAVAAVRAGVNKVATRGASVGHSRQPVLPLMLRPAAQVLAFVRVIVVPSGRLMGDPFGQRIGPILNYASILKGRWRIAREILVWKFLPRQFDAGWHRNRS